MNENASMPHRIAVKEAFFVGAEYPITFQNQTVGRAILSQYGLYYKIYCVCRFEQKQKYHIYVDSCDRSLDLGICVPEGDRFVLNRLIPMKKLGQGSFCFRATLAMDHFYPVSEALPIEQLANSKLTFRDGVMGLVFTDQSPVLQGSDPTPEYRHKSAQR